MKFWLKLRNDDAAEQTSDAAQRNIRYTMVRPFFRVLSLQ